MTGGGSNQGYLKFYDAAEKLLYSKIFVGDYEPESFGIGEAGNYFLEVSPSFYSWRPTYAFHVTFGLDSVSGGTSEPSITSPKPIDSSNIKHILTEDTPEYTVTTGIKAMIYDAAGGHQVSFADGSSGRVAAVAGNNSFHLTDNLSDWTVDRSGAMVLFYDADDCLQIVATTAA